MYKLSSMPSSTTLSFNYFPAHQPAATNSIYLQCTYTTSLQELSSQRCIWNLVEHLWWSFYFKRRAPLWMFDSVLDSRCDFFQ